VVDLVNISTSFFYRNRRSLVDSWVSGKVVY